MKCTFLSALIYKKPTMRETAALFTNRKWLKHAPRVLFLDCFPLSPFSTVSSLQTVCLKHSHTQKAKQQHCIQLSHIIGLAVSTAVLKSS